MQFLDPFDMTVYPMIGLVISAFVTIITTVKFHCIAKLLYNRFCKHRLSECKSRTCETNELDGSKLSTKFVIRYTLSPINGRFGINAKRLLVQEYYHISS